SHPPNFLLCNYPNLTTTASSPLCSSFFFFFPKSSPNHHKLLPYLRQPSLLNTTFFSNCTTYIPNPSFPSNSQLEPFNIRKSNSKPHFPLLRKSPKKYDIEADIWKWQRVTG
ncbi:hypothetical protein LINGRAHAP2_LOCUS7636, partial [Linum grandiflorum]